MDFGTFFLYFITSSLIYEAIIAIVLTIKHQYQKKQLQKAIASGKVKVMSMEELLTQMEEQDKKTWN